MTHLIIDPIKWQIAGFSKYAITSNSTIVNLKTGRRKKEFLNNGVRSFDLWDDNGQKKRKSIIQLRKLSKKI